jgi:hypothetical protein
MMMGIRDPSISDIAALLNQCLADLAPKILGELAIVLSAVSKRPSIG